ncbi:MAG: hypothetical protein RXP30_04245 [Thermoplasmata archaeon]|jgi:uncharacterized protein YjgD (DUF1641 family)|nr:hypothetical protein [Euryarchaeota archaeon]MVT15325.1 hypothetical protein [Euryarchaeota archaeon]MVT36047.1 hypothetical protein [Euryarchaeota archaeon]
MVKKTDVANKNTHSLLELMDLVKRDELVRVINKVIELQKDGTIDKLLGILEIMSKDKSAEKLYFKVQDMSEKGTLQKLLEGNLLDRTLDSLLKLLQDGSVFKLLDIVLDLQKKGILDQLVDLLSKSTVLLDRLFELQKQGYVDLSSISRLLEKLLVMMKEGTLEKLLSLLSPQLIELASALVDLLNSEEYKGYVLEMGSRLFILVDKIIELDRKGMLDITKISSIIEKVIYMFNNGTFDKLIDLLTMLSALLDALNDEMVKSIAQKANKALEIIEPGKL